MTGKIVGLPYSPNRLHSQISHAYSNLGALTRYVSQIWPFWGSTLNFRIVHVHLRCEDDIFTVHLHCEQMVSPHPLQILRTNIPSLKLIAPDNGWKTSFLLGWLPGRCYVSFREGILPQKDMLKIPRRPHVAELLLREIFLPLVRNPNHLNDASVAGVSKIFMPTLLSSTSFLLKEFWGLKKFSVKEGIIAPDPLPRFEKLEPAHASSVVSFTRASSYLMAAFIGVLVRQ